MEISPIATMSRAMQLLDVEMRSLEINLVSIAPNTSFRASFKEANRLLNSVPCFNRRLRMISYVPPSSCSDVNCVNYGGVNSSVLSVPNNILESDLISFCCNYNTRADFDEICEAEVLAVEYVSRGCCARQFCI